MHEASRNTPPNPPVHLHVRPRDAQPVRFDGVLFEDAAFGEHYDRDAVSVPAPTVRDRLGSPDGGATRARGDGR
jgi:hypothetical protein